MSVKKNVQKSPVSSALALKQKTKKSILKTPSLQLQLESNSSSSNESDTESLSMNSKSLKPKLNNGVSNMSNNDTSDASDREELSYDGDNNEESATDDESIIGLGDNNSEDELTNSLLQGTEHRALVGANNGIDDGPDKDDTAPTKQQQALANVMGSLLRKQKSVAELMNKPKSASRETEKVLGPEKGNKRKRGQTESVLEIVGENGKIEKVKTESKSSKKKKSSSEETKEIAEPGKRHFPVNAKTDPYCQDPYLDTDVVKEKKLRSLATQGVVQLFNTLEQFRQQSKDMSAALGGKGRYTAPRRPEVSAITSGGKAGLIDFLMKKGKVGGGFNSRTADRPLFSETKREEGPLESR